MRGTSKAERYAQELIGKFGIEHPVNLEDLCKQIDINIIDYYKLKIPGYFYRDTNCKLIFVNSSIKNEGRRRFVISHELGHYFLHSKETLQVCSGISEGFDVKRVVGETEKEANLFASEFLAPIDKVRQELPRKRLTFEFICNLADKYQVSITSMAIKCVQNSNSESETLLCYKNNALEWHACAETEVNLKWIPNSAPYGSMLYDILQHINDGTSKEVSAGDWKSYVGRCNEEVFMITQNTYLVLISGMKKEYEPYY